MFVKLTNMAGDPRWYNVLCIQSLNGMKQGTQLILSNGDPEVVRETPEQIAVEATAVVAGVFRGR